MPSEIDSGILKRAKKSHLKAQIALGKASDVVYRALSDAKVFNLSLETATQYNLCRFVDRGPNERTSDKLRDKVLYLETNSQRFEVSCKTNADYDSVYRLAEVANPYFKDEIFFSEQEILPLDASHLKQTLAEGLPWSDFLWGIDSLLIGNTDIKIGPLKNFLFRQNRNTEAKAQKTS